jgi:hypothetical protein
MSARLERKAALAPAIAFVLPVFRRGRSPGRTICVSGREDDPCDRGGRHGRDVMAGVDLDDVGLGSVRHGQLGLRRDRVVLASDDLPLRQSGRGGDRSLSVSAAAASGSCVAAASALARLERRAP